MIISASRRTDIPAHHSEWILEKIRERHVFVKNPMNPLQIRKVDLEPDNVDSIVFWSKNPKPMLDKLEYFNEYNYYFQFTLNPYDNDIEKHLPPKNEIIDTFISLSDKIGAHRVIWRYDPVLLNGRYSTAWHMDKFNELANQLSGYTEKVIFSYIDFYKKISARTASLGIMDTSMEEKLVLAESFSKSAVENSLFIETCAEGIDLSMYNIGHAKCIDGALIAKITGKDISAGKDKNQRPECGCIKSIDIGEYNSCSNGCIYCYASK